MAIDPKSYNLESTTDKIQSRNIASAFKNTAEIIKKEFKDRIDAAITTPAEYANITHMNTVVKTLNEPKVTDFQAIVSSILTGIPTSYTETGKLFSEIDTKLKATPPLLSLGKQLELYQDIRAIVNEAVKVKMKEIDDEIIRLNGVASPTADQSSLLAVLKVLKASFEAKTTGDDLSPQTSVLKEVMEKDGSRWEGVIVLNATTPPGTFEEFDNSKIATYFPSGGTSPYSFYWKNEDRGLLAGSISMVGSTDIKAGDPLDPSHAPLLLSDTPIIATGVTPSATLDGDVLTRFQRWAEKQAEEAEAEKQTSEIINLIGEEINNQINTATPPLVYPISAKVAEAFADNIYPILRAAGTPPYTLDLLARALNVKDEPAVKEAIKNIIMDSNPDDPLVNRYVMGEDAKSMKEYIEDPLRQVNLENVSRLVTELWEINVAQTHGLGATPIEFYKKLKEIIQNKGTGSDVNRKYFSMFSMLTNKYGKMPNAEVLTILEVLSRIEDKVPAIQVVQNKLGWVKHSATGIGSSVDFMKSFVNYKDFGTELIRQDPSLKEVFEDATMFDNIMRGISENYISISSDPTNIDKLFPTDPEKKYANDIWTAMQKIPHSQTKIEYVYKYILYKDGIKDETVKVVIQAGPGALKEQFSATEKMNDNDFRTKRIEYARARGKIRRNLFSGQGAIDAVAVRNDYNESLQKWLKFRMDNFRNDNLIDMTIDSHKERWREELLSNLLDARQELVTEEINQKNEAWYQRLLTWQKRHPWLKMGIGLGLAAGTYALAASGGPAFWGLALGYSAFTALGTFGTTTGAWEGLRSKWGKTRAGLANRAMNARRGTEDARTEHLAAHIADANNRQRELTGAFVTNTAAGTPNEFVVNPRSAGDLWRTNRNDLRTMIDVELNKPGNPNDVSIKNTIIDNILARELKLNEETEKRMEALRKNDGIKNIVAGSLALVSGIATFGAATHWMEGWFQGGRDLSPLPDAPMGPGSKIPGSLPDAPMGPGSNIPSPLPDAPMPTPIGSDVIPPVIPSGESVTMTIPDITKIVGNADKLLHPGEILTQDHTPGIWQTIAEKLGYTSTPIVEDPNILKALSSVNPALVDPNLVYTGQKLVLNNEVLSILSKRTGQSIPDIISKLSK